MLVDRGGYQICIISPSGSFINNEKDNDQVYEY